jgi:hypothetical protein
MTKLFFESAFNKFIVSKVKMLIKSLDESCPSNIKTTDVYTKGQSKQINQ